MNQLKHYNKFTLQFVINVKYDSLVKDKTTWLCSDVQINVLSVH